MITYYEIREKELTLTASYSERKFNSYVNLHKLLLKLYSEKFFWSLSAIPFILSSYFTGWYLLFLIGHFFFWILKEQKDYLKLCEADIHELELTILVLEDLRKERKTIEVKRTENS